MLTIVFVLKDLTGDDVHFKEIYPLVMTCSLLLNVDVTYSKSKCCGERSETWLSASLNIKLTRLIGGTFIIPMNGDAIYYDDHHLHDDDDVGGGESISVFDDIWEGDGTTYSRSQTQICREVAEKIYAKFLRGIVFHFYV